MDASITPRHARLVRRVSKRWPRECDGGRGCEPNLNQGRSRSGSERFTELVAARKSLQNFRARGAERAMARDIAGERRRWQVGPEVFTVHGSYSQPRSSPGLYLPGTQ